MNITMAQCASYEDNKLFSITILINKIGAPAKEV